jgi:hypothetical protein
MRPANRLEECRAVQRESMKVVAVLRKALFSLRLGSAPSPVQGGFRKPPSPFVPTRMGLAPITLGAGKVTDRHNSRLACYFRNCR